MRAADDAWPERDVLRARRRRLPARATPNIALDCPDAVPLAQPDPGVPTASLSDAVETATRPSADLIRAIAANVQLENIVLQLKTLGAAEEITDRIAAANDVTAGRD